MAIIMQKRYRVGDVVKIYRVLVYPLPADLTEGMEVKVVAIDVGCCTVEREGKLYQVFQPCIDSGWIELTKLPPLRPRQQSGPPYRKHRDSDDGWSFRACVEAGAVSKKAQSQRRNEDGNDVVSLEAKAFEAACGGRDSAARIDPFNENFMEMA